ncbi:MAG: glycosyltransferase family 2 protein [Cryomorphaceae bacterium]|nr:glycosyltransferase family 2 protein [Cryomorphaceae bacterium]
MTLDIVLPCFNPTVGWETTVIDNYKQLCATLPEVEISIILVNDGANYGIENYMVKNLTNSIPLFIYLENNKNMGKGYTLRKGVEQAKGDYIIVTDIDFPYTNNSFINLFNELKNNNLDICLGVRSEAYYNNIPAQRTKLSKSLRLITKKLLKLPVDDTQCGLKGFNKIGKKVFLQTKTNSYLYDIEFIYLASRDNSIAIGSEVVLLKNETKIPNVKISLLFRELLNFSKLILSLKLKPKL